MSETVQNYMRAARFHTYGSPDVLVIEDGLEPHAGAGEVRIRVAAASVNPLDWKIRSGTFLEHSSPETIYLDESFAQRLSTPFIKPHYPMAIIRGLLAIAEDLDITVIARGVRGRQKTTRLEPKQGRRFEQALGEAMKTIYAPESHHDMQ